MPPFPPNIKPAQIDDFLLGVRHKMAKEDPTDIITPKYPLFMKMEKASISAIVEENPGHGPVRDVYYQTEDRYTELSKSNQIESRDFRTQEHSTRAQYDWYMLINTLYISKWEWENLKTPEELVNVIARKKKGTDKSHRNLHVTRLWNGYTLGNEKLFGLKDAIRFTTTSDPARGAIGGLSVDDLPTWTNVSKNFNAAYQTFVSGAETQTFLDEGANSLLSLYSDVTYVDQEAGNYLICANSPYWRVCNKLARAGIMMYDTNAKVELGVPGIAFQGATIFEDRNVPDDPNTSTYGVAFLLSTDCLNWVYSKGIRMRWSDSVNHIVDTAMSWDKVSQFTIAYSDLRRLGVHYGVNPTAAAS